MANPRDAPADAPRGAASARSILINSVVALLLGAAITVLVHELAHWVTGALLGSRSYLFSFGVTHEPPLTGGAAATAALAGPVVSLLVGSAMQILQPFRFRGDFAHLLWIWVACTSLMEAATYLVITPFVGDTHTAAAALGWPSWVSWVAAAIGVLGMVGVAREWAIHSVRLCGHDLTRLRCFSWYPWLIAIPVQAGLALLMISVVRMQLTPAEQTVVIMAGMAQTVFAPMSIPFTRQSKELEEPLQVRPVPWVGVAGFVAMVVFNFAISGGIGLG